MISAEQRKKEKNLVKCQKCQYELPASNFWPNWTICCKCFRLESLVKAANDPRSWLLQAKDLWNAAMIIQDHQKGQEGHMTTDAINAITMSAPKWLLLGFAFENLFKAIWLRMGNRIMNDEGSLVIPNVFKRHNLLQMANTLSFSLDVNEKKVLEVLTKYTKSLGRYPVAEYKCSDEKQVVSFSSPKPQKFLTWGEEEDISILRIKERCEKALQ